MLRPTAAESSCPVSPDFRARDRDPGLSRSSRREFSRRHFCLSFSLSVCICIHICTYTCTYYIFLSLSLTVAPVASFTRLTDWLTGWRLTDWLTDWLVDWIGLFARTARSCLLCVDWMRIGWVRIPSSLLFLSRFIRPPPRPTLSPQPFCRHRCRSHRSRFISLYSSTDLAFLLSPILGWSYSSTCSSRARDLLSVSALDTLVRRDLAASSSRGLFWAKKFLPVCGRPKLNSRNVS